MLRQILGSVVLCGLAAIAGRADVTLRYSVDFKAGPAMPPQAVEAMKTQLQMPMKQVTYLKGSKAYAKVFGFTAISDFDGAVITVLDPKNKRYATVSAAEYVAAAGKQAELPPEARKVLEAMRFDVTSRATGRASVIKGIDAEERELVLSMSMPAGLQGGPKGMRMVYSIWTPRSDAAVNNPALQELALYTARAYAGMNPADMMQKMFTQTPGMAQKLKAMIDEFKNMQAVLGFRGAMYVPGMAEMMEKLRQAGQPVPEGLDPNAPMMEFTMDLEEMSTATVPDSVFQVPSDYVLGPMDEVMKSALPPRPTPPPKP
jgi:hypothetical protein